MLEDEEEQETLICCLCNYTIEHEMFPNGGYMGNNPAPLTPQEPDNPSSLRCCDWCNSLKVTPARLGLTGEAAEKMGRALIHSRAIQMHMIAQHYTKEEIPEGASEK